MGSRNGIGLAASGRGWPAVASARRWPGSARQHGSNSLRECSTSWTTAGENAEARAAESGGDNLVWTFLGRGGTADVLLSKTLGPLATGGRLPLPQSQRRPTRPTSPPAIHQSCVPYPIQNTPSPLAHDAAVAAPNSR